MRTAARKTLRRGYSCVGLAMMGLTALFSLTQHLWGDWVHMPS